MATPAPARTYHNSKSVSTERQINIWCCEWLPVYLPDTATVADLKASFQQQLRVSPGHLDMALRIGAHVVKDDSMRVEQLPAQGAVAVQLRARPGYCLERRIIPTIASGLERPSAASTTGQPLNGRHLEPAANSSGAVRPATVGPKQGLAVPQQIEEIKRNIDGYERKVADMTKQALQECKATSEYLTREILKLDAAKPDPKAANRKEINESRDKESARINELLDTLSSMTASCQAIAQQRLPDGLV